MGKRFYWRYILYAVFIGVLTALSLSTYKTYKHFHQSILKNDADVEWVQIKPHSTAVALLNDLYSRRLINNKTLLLHYMHHKKIEGMLKAGVYQIIPGESIVDFLNKVVKGEVVSLSFTLIEGISVGQLQQAIKKAPWLCDNFSSESDKLKQDYPSLEGLFLADTYQYNAGTSADQLLLRAKTALEAYLKTLWMKRKEGLPYKNSYELLIAASLIEKETANAIERPLIASVLVNRLMKGMPLQMDPSVIYALGDHYTGMLHHADLLVDSPYNTYRYKGLPPSPIAIVGKEALNAAAMPASTTFLYFVAKGDGTHYFSNTYAEHKKAISLFSRKNGKNHE